MRCKVNQDYIAIARIDKRQEASLLHELFASVTLFAVMAMILLIFSLLAV